MMTSASSSSSSRGGKSHSPNSGLMDAQKLLASIALSRPAPFGEIPRRVSQQRTSPNEAEETHSTRKRPTSAHGNEHGSAQILSFATRRPSEPQIPTSTSTLPTATPSSSSMHLHVPMDVKLSVTDAFDYDDEWLEGGKQMYAASSSRDGLDSLPLSPTSPSEEWDERLSATSTSQPRSRQATSSRSRESTSPSTPTSSRSSSLRRKPSLLNQILSPPTSSSQYIAVNGRQIITPTQAMVSSSAKGKQSQSLAERGHSIEATIKANMPELYTISRGRSNRVSPSRRWDRRGASASVLSSAASATAVMDGENSESTLTSSKIVRKESAGSLEHALFDSDDDGELFQSSEDEDEYNIAEHGEETTLQGSRRSSVDRDRRRELRILLAAPSTSQESGSDVNEKMISHSLSTAESGTSEGNGSTDDRLSLGKGSADSQHDQDLQSSNDSMRMNNVDLADDESDGTMATSAASLLSRRSKHGRKTLRSTLKSVSPQSRVPLDVILAGMTPSEERNPMDVKVSNEEKKEEEFLPSSYISRSSAMSSDRNSSSVRAMSTTSVPVDADSDPLLGQSFGSVADNMQVDAVEWNDNLSVSSSNAGTGVSTPTLTNARPSLDLRKSVAEQEDERRTGFAAAYQQRLSALSMRLWSNGKSGRSREKSVETNIDPKEQRSSKSPERGSEAKSTAPSAGAHPSLFTSSWRHLAMLPNLLLAPALGTASSSQTQEGSTTSALKEGEEFSSFAQVIENASSHIAQDSTDTPNDREAALQAAQKAVAHLASVDPKAHPPMLASRTIVAIDRALEEMHQGDVNHTLTTSTSKQDHSVNRKRCGRGVMTPLEADADVSAYVSGLGLPIDPDVELSSVVHLQTFRSDTRARRATSHSRESAAGMSNGIETDKREHKRTFSDSQKQSSPLMSSKIVTPSEPAIVEAPLEKDTAEAKFEKMLSNKRGSRDLVRDFSSRRAATVRAPKCARPAVQAPVPGNYSAYNSSASDEDVQHDTEAAKYKKDNRRSRREGSVEDVSRGRGRSSAKRSTSPTSNQQCAIGLFSSTSSNLSRSRSGRQGRKSGQSTPTEEIAPLVMRVRSSPNLSAMNSQETSALQAEGEEEQEEDRSRRSIKRDRDEGKESGRVGGRRRGRGDGVKRVSASFADAHQSSKTLIRSNSMSDLPLLNAKLIASSVHASSLASSGGMVTNVSKSNGSLSTSTNGTSLSSHSSSSSTESAIRLPIVGAGNIPHLAGRPSMVSNGAHLLMLSLELEMMRNRKITGSLKPRWLKARMRTEPFGPAAIVAMIAAERQSAATAVSTSEDGAEIKEDESNDDSPSSITHTKHHHSRPHHPHEHKAHIGLHTAHHSAVHHGQHHNQQHIRHGKQAIDRNLGYNQPKNRSSLRFELE